MGRSSRFVWLVFVATALPSCGEDLPPAMTPVSALPAVAPGSASVVFVRPKSPCDTGDYEIIVDEQGRFVGNASPGSQLAVSVQPGTHVFYGWSARDLRIEGRPEFNPVAAARVNAIADGPTYVALVVEVRRTTSMRCWKYAVVDMYPSGPGRSYFQEIQEWLTSTTPLVADPPRGQSLLDADPAMLQSDLDLGRAKLALLDQRRALRAQEKAEQSDDAR
jgi:hypothetical protein